MRGGVIEGGGAIVRHDGWLMAMASMRAARCSAWLGVILDSARLAAHEMKIAERHQRPTEAYLRRGGWPHRRLRPSAWRSSEKLTR